MADLIGPVQIDAISSFSLRGNIVVISGWQTSKVKLESLAELFRKAPENSAIQTVMGGVQRGYDLTDDSLLTWRCLFDDARLRDGYYLLRNFRYTASRVSNHYPFWIEIFFLGGNLQPGYLLTDLESVTNDWNI
ncbi:MAG: hypothetical protein ACTSYJ_00130 [Candidatus Thorarchaeota archaeon]